MQQQVEEAEVQVAALQAIVALQPLPPVQAHLSLTRDNQRIIKTFCNTPLNMCILILNINGPLRAKFCTKGKA
jgi:hypothetical protein